MQITTDPALLAGNLCLGAHYQDERVAVLHADCLAALAAMPAASVDSIVTDPPYGLGFMGKAWDDLPPGEAWARECLRVLKPGGHLLTFGGSRTWHRLAVAVEDAGFEVRDSIAWLYGSGMPKSQNVGKMIDKAAGRERTEKLAPKAGHENFVGRDNMASLRGGTLAQEGGFSRPWMSDPEAVERAHWDYAPATPEAAQWEGWGTALKPAFEPIVVARKPLAGTVAANVLAHGTGALNVDGCRVAGDEDGSRNRQDTTGKGRWPANVVLDDTQAAELDRQSGTLASGANPTRRSSDKFRDAYGEFAGQAECAPARGADRGGASRFFYVAKAPTSERPRVDGTAHPTVKPLTLMRWLVRLVTPPGGLVLDPFAGSGTTLEAAILEGFRCVGIEREADYLPLIAQRIDRAYVACGSARPYLGEIGARADS